MTIVEVNGLTKHYAKHSNRTVKDAIRMIAGNSLEQFVALQSITFKIKKGEIVGLVGHNGAGKSTLLKILSGVIPPSSGSGIVHTTVGSILEIGTGFHPDLTGRDNVFLNGAVLGMHRCEIREYFQAISDFSEIGDFIDEPVKCYSSGMIVRLAFAVVAHLTAEFLIIDEALAVGDASFQEKCMAKLHSLANSGRTVMIVSHNEEAIRKLCSRVLLLDHGRLLWDGNVGAGLDKYNSLRTVRPQ